MWLKKHWIHFSLNFLFFEISEKKEECLPKCNPQQSNNVICSVIHSIRSLLRVGKGKLLQTSNSTYKWWLKMKLIKISGRTKKPVNEELPLLINTSSPILHGPIHIVWCSNISRNLSWNDLFLPTILCVLLLLSSKRSANNQKAVLPVLPAPVAAGFTQVIFL